MLTLNKNVILFFLISIIGVSSILAQNKAEKYNNNIKTLKEACLIVKNINKNIKNYTMKNTPLYESTEGGSLDKYYKNNSLKKISAKYMGETGKREVCIYFDKETPIYVQDKESKYNLPIYSKKRISIKINSDEYWLFENKIIRWLHNNKNMKDKEYTTKTEEINKLIRELVDK
jgi:hypothetical protein